MNKIQELALALVVIGVIIIAAYFIFILAAIEKIPFLIRAGGIVIIIGILVALISVIRDRVREIKREKRNK